MSFTFLKRSILILSALLVFWGCERNSSGPQQQGGPVVALQLVYNHPGGGAFDLTRWLAGVPPAPGRRSQSFPGLAKNHAAAAIDRAEVVFYDIGVDTATLFQNLQDPAIQQQVYELTMQTDPATFEEWIQYGASLLDVVTRNQSRIERRADLTISQDRARGEFRLQEGYKAALLGFFENGEFVYIGDSEFFEATPEDTAYVTVYMYFTGPIGVSIQSPQDSFSTTERVVLVYGAAVGSGDLSGLSGILVINGSISQGIAIDSLGFFSTAAILTQRTNTLEVTVFDSLSSNNSASDMVTVFFTGNFPALRATLSWDGYGDLDLHMLDPAGNECYFLNPSIGGMVLDVDNVSGFGPENISVVSQVTGIYTVFVENFSGTTGLTATVKIFKYNQVSGQEELIDEQTHLFSTPDPWDVGQYPL